MLLHAFWRTAWTWAFLACICSTSSVLFAQDDNGDDDEDGDEIVSNMAGVAIDATGVLRVMQIDPRVANAQRLATLQSTPRGQLKTSPMRKVSLNRLEEHVKQELSAGRKLSSEALSMAGLQRVEYVLYLPETQDIVIAGPADQWYADEAGRFVGLTNGRSTLHLEDMVVALRAFGPDSGATKTIGCSIDPTPEGLKRMEAFRSQFTQMPSDIRQYVAGMRNSLGMQVVSIRGVPRSTHFARVLVEADYRMKLIGIGLADPLVPMKSWAERSQSSGGSNALQRWFFEADYSTVASNESGTVMHLKGRGVKLSGAQEAVQSKTGTRSNTGRAGDAASVAFTKDFTNKFDDIADATPVFHEMRNLFDMSVAAAFIQDRNLYEKANWKLGSFASEETFPVESGTEVSQVETAINAFMRNNQLATPIGGGVHIAARSLVNPSKMTVSPQVEKDSESMGAPKDLGNDQWWWD